VDEVHPARQQRQRHGAGAPADRQAAPTIPTCVRFLSPPYRETIDVGRANGVALPADALDKILDFTSHVPPAMKASMALDLDRGNRLELPWLGGKVVEARP